MGPRAGLDGSGMYRPSTGFRSLARLAPSESLYRLSYRDPQTSSGYLQNSTLATPGCLRGPVTLRSHVCFVLGEIEDGKKSGRKTTVHLAGANLGLGRLGSCLGR